MEDSQKLSDALGTINRLCSHYRCSLRLQAGQLVILDKLNNTSPALLPAPTLPGPVLHAAIAVLSKDSSFGQWKTQLQTIYRFWPECAEAALLDCLEQAIQSHADPTVLVSRFLLTYQPWEAHNMPLLACGYTAGI